MKNKIQRTLLASTALVLALSFAAPSAQAADSEVLTKLQEQIAALQKEIDSLKTAQAKSQAQIQAVAAAPAVAASASTVADATARAGSGKVADKVEKAIEDATGAKVTFGGFFNTTFLYRTKNQNTDVGSNWNASIPYENSKDAHQPEFRGSMRLTRFSMAATGTPDKDTTIGGYLETDFYGTASTSNPVQTNSWTPRVRQAFASYERSDLGLHFLAGQAWSMATQNTQGITARKEFIPGTVDGGYVPGFIYTRNTQLRLVKDFADKKVWAGLSLESPQTNYGGLAVPTALVYTQTGPVLNGSTTSAVSADIAPDVIAKVAFDPGFGHYEVFGMTRFFRDRTIANKKNNTAVGVGGGASAYVKVIPNKMEVMASAMAGKGIGRYMGTQMPDYAFSSTGDMKPLTGYAALFGVIGHPTPTWDVFGYAGVEQVLRKNYNGGAVGTTLTYGYGDFAIDNSGCYTEGGTCVAQTKRVWQVTGGVWKSIYKGNYGNIKVGLQQSFTRKEAFSGLNNLAPHTTEKITMTSFVFTPSF